MFLRTLGLAAAVAVREAHFLPQYRLKNNLLNLKVVGVLIKLSGVPWRPYQVKQMWLTAGTRAALQLPGFWQKRWSLLSPWLSVPSSYINHVSMWNWYRGRLISVWLFWSDADKTYPYQHMRFINDIKLVGFHLEPSRSKWGLTRSTCDHNRLLAVMCDWFTWTLAY